MGSIARQTKAQETAFQSTMRLSALAIFSLTFLCFASLTNAEYCTYYCDRGLTKEASLICASPLAGQTSTSLLVGKKTVSMSALVVILPSTNCAKTDQDGS